MINEFYIGQTVCRKCLYPNVGVITKIGKKYIYVKWINGSITSKIEPKGLLDVAYILEIYMGLVTSYSLE